MMTFDLSAVNWAVVHSFSVQPFGSDRTAWAALLG